MLFQKKYLIGQELVRRGVISQDHLDEALIEHERSGLKLGKILVKWGYCTEDDLLKVLSDQLSIPVFRISDTVIPDAVVKLASESVARKYKLVPVREDDKTITVCMSEPFDPREIEAVKSYFKKPLVIVMDSDRNVLRAIRKYYGLIDKDDLEFIEDEEGF